MKIAQLIPHFDKIGGIQVCVHNISERIARRGHDVHILCKDHMDPYARYTYQTRPFIHFRFTPQNYVIGRFWVQLYIRMLQRKYRYDIWQINGGYPYGAALAGFFRRSHIPAVLRCSGEDIQTVDDIGYGVRLNPKIDRIVRKTYTQFPSLVAITQTVKDEYLRIGVPEENITLIPNGVDFKRIAARHQPENIRGRHRIPSDAKLILTVGRHHPKKRYAIIPEILKEILDMGIDAFWIVIGRGCSNIDGSHILGKDAFRLIPIEAISFEKGKYDIPSDELISYYQSADVFAMTSWVETFGIVLIEALSAGVPVVCFNVPGVRDIMNPDCGVMCDSGDTAKFAEAIAKITSIKDPAALTAQCRQYAGRFSWDDITGRYLALYESLLS